ncbi:hypothetical protein VDGD_21222 [Verticillium dahliae]|nr:hypothetical protein VDGD_21222 [Verticillium dahliae]
MAASPALEASQDISRLSLEEIRAHEQPRPAPPVPASASTPGIVAFDITSRFRKAASTLAPGELVKDGFFTLFESVGALEIMDPKMDSGCLEPGESLDNDYDVSKPLLPEEVLGIIDQLLCHEMAWHVGYPLSQTVFTCAYVESILMPAPSTLDEAHFIRNPAVTTPSPMHAVLRAYCLGLLKTCGQVNESIINEHYYEARAWLKTNPLARLVVLTNMTGGRLCHKYIPQKPPGQIFHRERSPNYSRNEQPPPRSRGLGAHRHHPRPP